MLSINLQALLVQIVISISIFCLYSKTLAHEFSGQVEGDVRLFIEAPLFEEQRDYPNASISLSLEYYHSWNDGVDSFIFIPFGRIDQHDHRRSHIDIRELSWTHRGEDWSLLVGINKVFWGVTESNHLIDIINQTDLVENPDFEEKLGQPMINYNFLTDFGSIDLFLLPYFRERTFSGPKGRFRQVFDVNDDSPVYESRAEKWHTDGAIRWSYIFDNMDIGLSHFYGTNREPRLVPTLSQGTTIELIPHYDIIHQTGIDLQLTHNAWLWKFEGIYQTGGPESYVACVGGFEFTAPSIFNTQTDIGLLMEYHYDEREEKSTTPYDDDIFIGGRIVLNDVNSTELLTGMIADINNSTRFYILEASHRIDDYLKTTIEARIMSNAETTDPFWSWHKDDYVSAKLTYYF